MRRAHFDALRPVCPVCKTGPLSIAHAAREENDDLLEGILTCTNAECSREYPVIDGIPILVAPIRAWLTANPLQVLLRDDLSPEVESLIGDVLGSGSQYDTLRQHTGIYAHDHYESHSARAILLRSAGVPPAVPPASRRPSIDIGCATGGTTFTLAEQTHSMTLGIDLNFAMLRIASRALREGKVRYAHRRVGLVYDRRELPFDSPHKDLVDFWCCDAAALPFPEATFSLATSLNLLDCVHAPRDLLHEVARVTNGTVVLATPYDWSTNATPVESWLGGHSQRGPHRGASEPVLHALLAEAGLTVVSEEPHVPWRVRLHERSSIDYDVHLVVARSGA
jgi:SAM-dependent methyltransferase/uncharacterized protein YbaR (Trm112 family)